MKAIKTPSFLRLAGSLETGWGYRPTKMKDEPSLLNDSDDEATTNPEKIEKRFDQQEMLPSHRVYQEGVDVPDVDRHAEDNAEE